MRHTVFLFLATFFLSASLAAQQEEPGVSHAITSFSTQHPGVYYYPYLIGYDGCTVELHDGSIWSIKTADRGIVWSWASTDPIVITQNSALFSLYGYRLLNCETGHAVHCNLQFGPVYGGFGTYWVDWIDYDNRIVFLNDLSRFEISMWDTETLDQWAPNDTIILGVNSQFDRRWNPHILINVSFGGYVKAERIL